MLDLEIASVAVEERVSPSGMGRHLERLRAFLTPSSRIDAFLALLVLVLVVMGGLILFEVPRVEQGPSGHTLIIRPIFPVIYESRDGNLSSVQTALMVVGDLFAASMILWAIYHVCRIVSIWYKLERRLDQIEEWSGAARQLEEVQDSRV